MLLYFITTVPGIIILIKFALEERKAEKLIGVIDEVIAQYRGSTYRVSVNHDSMKIKKEIRPNHNFQLYKKNQHVDMYAIQRSNGYIYKFKEGYYVLPIVIIGAGLFLTIMFIGLAQK